MKYHFYSAKLSPFSFQNILSQACFNESQEVSKRAKFNPDAKSPEKNSTSGHYLLSSLFLLVPLFSLLFLYLIIMLIINTRSSTHSYPCQVSLPNPRTLSHKSSFIPRTHNLWNVLSHCFAESYNLPSFKI